MVCSYGDREAGYHLNHTEKHKKIAFTTHDGYGLLEGFEGLLFYVDLDYSESVNTCDLCSEMAKGKNTVIFYKRENAQKFLKKNTPRYTQAEIEQAFKNFKEEFGDRIKFPRAQIFINEIDNVIKKNG